MYEKINLNNIGIVSKIVIPFCFVIINGSVLGNVYHTNILTSIFFLMLILKDARIDQEDYKNNGLIISNNKRIKLLCLLILISMILNLKFIDGLLFIILLNSFYSYYDLHFYDKEISLSSNIIMLLSIAILVGYSSGRVLTQWNPNQIALICCPAMFLYFFELMSGKRNLLKVIIYIIYLYFTWKTGARSVIFGGLICFLVYRISQTKIFLNSCFVRMNIIRLIAITPVIIIVYNMIYLSISSNFTMSLELLMQKYFSKTVFTGREYIWTEWIPQLFGTKFLLIGEGERINGNFHNLLIDIWYSFGAIFTIVYINTMFKSWKNILQKFDDKFILLSFCCFSGLFTMQSFECLSSDTKYFFPFMYIFSAMALGRTAYIDAYEE